MLILIERLQNTLNTFPYQLIIYILKPVTNNGLAYPKKIGNYQQTFCVITKNNGKNENRDNINIWTSWFYSLTSWSDKA